MNVVGVNSVWNAFLHPQWMQSLHEVPFLGRCREGTITREALHSYVRQQCYYSQHFMRYLSALLSNLLLERDRQDLVHNLFEEMGLGDMASVPHSQLYRQMMEAMGIRPEDEPIFPATQALIETMLECCQSRYFMVGLGALCLGAEAIVPYLYSTVVRGFEAVGEPSNRLKFFHIHIEGDDEHAMTMKRIIERELERDPSTKVDLDYGAAKALSARVRFLREIGDRAHLAHAA